MSIQNLEPSLASINATVEVLLNQPPWGRSEGSANRRQLPPYYKDFFSAIQNNAHAKGTPYSPTDYKEISLAKSSDFVSLHGSVTNMNTSLYNRSMCAYN
jgi:hypothetical protein